MNYYEKYLKYKNKYLNLKKQFGGMTTYEVQIRNPNFLKFSSNNITWVFDWSQIYPFLSLYIREPYLYLDIDLNQTNDIIKDILNENNQTDNVLDVIGFLRNELDDNPDENVQRVLNKLKHLFD